MTYSIVQLEISQTTSEYSLWKQNRPAARSSFWRHPLSGPLIRSSGPPACGHIPRHRREWEPANFSTIAARRRLWITQNLISPAEKTIRSLCETSTASASSCSHGLVRRLSKSLLSDTQELIGPAHASASRS